MAKLFSGFRESHGSFFSSIYYVAFFLSYLWGLSQQFVYLVQAAQAGDVLQVLVIFIFGFFLAFLPAILGALLWGTVFSILLAIPYFIYKGIVSRPSRVI